jgi:Flp pilus assembly protein TadG
MNPRCPRPAQVDREKGQSLIEMAFLVPILLVLLAAVVDAGRAFDAYIVLTNAAREGARYGSFFPWDTAATAPAVQQLVVDDVVGSGTNITRMDDFQLSNVTVEGIGMGSTAVTVTVSYDFGLWFGGVVGLDTFHLNKQAVMPVY